MIYITASDKSLHVVILETANLDEIKKGRPAKTPDGEVLICWTPDPVWLADKLMDCGGDMVLVGKLIDEASKRPQAATPRPYHKQHVHQFEKEDAP